MKGKRAAAVSIIGGASGPTSIWIAGKAKEKNIFRRLKNEIMQAKFRAKRKRAISKIKIEPHSLPEVCDYIKGKYVLQEIDSSHYSYESSFLSVKTAIICEYKPELLAEEKMIELPEDLSNETDMKAYFDKVRELEERRRQQIVQAEFPIDFHRYIILLKGYGEIFIDMENTYGFMGGGYSCEGRKQSYLENIIKEIYLYYGVTQEDIDKRTRRYESLVSIMSI